MKRDNNMPRISSVGLVGGIAHRDNFVYPQHIDRASLDALPNSPGVYIFRDAQQRPLYVGKSVTLRSRVLSHLRNADEAKMLHMTHDIQHQSTAGEIGALLLEAQLIKHLQPIFNVKLRQQRNLCSLQFQPSINDDTSAAPRFVLANQYDFARSEHLYGLFSGKKAALDCLRNIVEQHHLCPAQSGLEQVVHGRACFAHQIGRCRGACVGLESLDMHQQRLLAALHDLRLMVWPFDGPVGIVEERGDWRQMHIVDLWSYLGSIDLQKGSGASSSVWTDMATRRQAKFDADTYKILFKFLLSGNLQLEIPSTIWRLPTSARRQTGQKRACP